MILSGRSACAVPLPANGGADGVRGEIAGTGCVPFRLLEAQTIL